MTRSELILFCKMISCFNVITFHNRERVIVIFRTRIFELSGKGITPIHGKILDISHAQDKENGNELISYAKNYVKPRLWESWWRESNPWQDSGMPQNQGGLSTSSKSVITSVITAFGNINNSIIICNKQIDSRVILVAECIKQGCINLKLKRLYMPYRASGRHSKPTISHNLKHQFHSANKS